MIILECVWTAASEVLAECRYCRYIYLFRVRRRRRRGTRMLSSRWWRMSPSHVWSFNYLGGPVLTLLLLTRVNFMAFWLRFLTYNIVVLCFDVPLGGEDQRCKLHLAVLVNRHNNVFAKSCLHLYKFTIKAIPRVSVIWEFCWILIKIIWFSAAIKCCKIHIICLIMCFVIVCIKYHCILC